MRHDDEEKAVTGFPAVPKEFQPYLLAKPIETEISEVGASESESWGNDFYNIETVVTLKHGKSAGLLPGMKLYITESDNIDSVTVKKVEADHSEGVMTHLGDKGAKPKVGRKLSTLAPWHKK